jgi:hypothetical protein
MKEFLIYGLPPEELRENTLGLPSLLHVETSLPEAKRIAAILERKYGCTEITIKTFELDGTVPDFAGTVAL